MTNDIFDFAKNEIAKIVIVKDDKAN